MIDPKNPERCPWSAVGVAALLFSLGICGTALAEGELTILDAEERCISSVPYPIVDATIEPGEGVAAAKVFFRAVQGADFFYVEMTPAGADVAPSGFTATLPAPDGTQTRQVVYYIEAVSEEFESTRTEEFTVEVVPEEECDEDRFLGTNPGIVVYSLSRGATLSGFSTAGIASVVGSGGLSAGAIAGIAVGGAAVGIAVIDALDDDDEVEEDMSAGRP